MNNIPYVIDLLRSQVGVVAVASDFGYESVLLEREELDPNLLPVYFDEIQTEEEVLVDFYAIDEYTVYIIADVENLNWKLIGIIKNGTLAYSKVFD